MLSMIVDRGGNTKSEEEGELRVRLKRFKNLAIDSAAGRLCEDLNFLNPKTLDRFQHPFHYVM